MKRNRSKENGKEMESYTTAGSEKAEEWVKIELN